MKRALFFVLMTACVGETPEVFIDAGSSPDAGPSMDTGPGLDASEGRDSGGSDAGAFDAGPMVDSGWMLDTGVDAPIANDAGPMGGEACPPEADLLCDDFEDGIGDPWIRREREGGEVMETADGYDGSGVRLRLGLPNGTSALLQVNSPTWATGAFWGRFHARMERHPSNHGHLIEASGPADGRRSQYRLDINAGRLNSRYFHPDIPQHGGLRKNGNDMPLEEWVCIEWFFDLDNNEMRYYFDGTENMNMRVDGSEDPVWDAPVVDRFAIGIHHYQEDTEVTEMTIDSIAIGTSRIGCQ